eukprot:snap_masked-scaffold_52-processed-gene-1.61-mRNA-1 protein AED:1.00 eAED:1.00 QI:0/0/0/0/1/1/2/0/129
MARKLLHKGRLYNCGNNDHLTEKFTVPRWSKCDDLGHADEDCIAKENIKTDLIKAQVRLKKLQEISNKPKRKLFNLRFERYTNGSYDWTLYAGSTPEALFELPKKQFQTDLDGKGLVLPLFSVTNARKL